MSDFSAEPDDQTLLRAFTREGSDRAFAELVRRHVHTVFSSAMRRVNNERALAEDITQQVFTDLARKARTLAPETVLGGWLHRHTGFIALKAIARERRRKTIEHEAAVMTTMEESDPLWHQAAPLLDAALDQLPAADRDALMLRFFEKRDLRTVGGILGVSDDTAQKRVSRALEKLRDWLARRGVTSTAGALSVVLSTQAVGSAPALLEASVAGTALAKAAATGGTLASMLALLSNATRWKIGAATAVLAGALIWQQTEIRRLREASPTAEKSFAAITLPSQTAMASTTSNPPIAAIEATIAEADIIQEAAAILRGGAQDISATTKALTVLGRIDGGRIPDVLSKVAEVRDEAAQALLYKYLIGRWAEFKPWDALHYVRETLPTKCLPEVFEGVMTAWSGKDPESALAWFGKTRATVPRPMNESLLATIFRGLGTRDLPAATAQLSWLQTENERAQALRGLLDAVNTDEKRATILDKIGALPEEEIRRQARRAVVEQWVRTDAGAAASFVEKVEPPYERSRLMDSLGMAWLLQEPEKAADWWISHAPPADTLIKIMNVWAHNDPNAAGTWLRGQPAGPDSDPARMTFARQVSDLDPESALHWAETISGVSQRESTIDHVFSEWRARDTTAATNFLQKSQWPEERVTRLASSGTNR